MAIQIRRGTDSGWESNNSNIVAGEPAVTTDTGRFFVGVDDGEFVEFASKGYVDTHGISDGVKQALLQLASKVAYIDDDGQDYYDALESALYPTATLVSISAVYTQSGTVYDTDSLDSLKQDLVVTANYDDGTTQTVLLYTLSGTLTTGTSTITVSYGDKTTTFTVTVTHNDILYALPSTFTSDSTNSIDTGVVFGLNKQYTVVCTFAISTFRSSTADPTSACVFGDMHGESSNYNALNEQKVSGGGNAGTYCWGNGLSWAESKNFVSENNTIKHVLTFDISSTGSTKNWYIKNVTQSTSKSGTLTKTDVLSIKGYNVFIGKQETSGGSPGFIGTMSDFKIYDRILTADEITAYLG